ncbi:MAG: Hpt domain-containing protein [Clostridia bacterium]|nr:Hpt domain-containing protein [Clostridia bacterium]
MTLDTLTAYGANTAEGMGRCLNDEPFYLDMVVMALKDKNFDLLKDAMNAGDARAAFSAAHSLKGSVGNVALTPIYEPLCVLTELLRGKDAKTKDGGALLEEIMAQREKALAL